MTLKDCVSVTALHSPCYTAVNRVRSQPHLWRQTRMQGKHSNSTALVQLIQVLGKFQSANTRNVALQRGCHLWRLYPLGYIMLLFSRRVRTNFQGPQSSIKILRCSSYVSGGNCVFMCITSGQIFPFMQ